MSGNGNIKVAPHSSALTVTGSSESLGTEFIPYPPVPDGWDTEEDEGGTLSGDDSLVDPSRSDRATVQHCRENYFDGYIVTDENFFDVTASIGANRGLDGSKKFCATQSMTWDESKEDDHNQNQDFTSKVEEESKHSKQEWKVVGETPKKNQGSNMKLTLKYFGDIGNLKEMLSLAGVKFPTIIKRGDSIVIKSSDVRKTQEWHRTKSFHATTKFVRCIFYVSPKTKLQKRLPRGVLSMKRWNEKSAVVEVTFFNGFFAAQAIRNGILVNSIFRDVFPKVKKNKSDSSKKVRELADKEKQALLDEFGDYEDYVNMPWSLEEYQKKLSNKSRTSKKNKGSGKSKPNYADKVRKSKNIIPEKASETVQAVKDEHAKSKKMISQQKKEMNSLRDVIRRLDDDMIELRIEFNKLKSENQSSRDKVKNLENRCKNLCDKIEEQDSIIQIQQEKLEELTKDNSGLRKTQSETRIRLQDLEDKYKEVQGRFEKDHHNVGIAISNAKKIGKEIGRVMKDRKEDRERVDMLVTKVENQSKSLVTLRESTVKGIDDCDKKIRDDIFKGMKFQLRDLYQQVLKEQKAKFRIFGEQFDQYFEAQLGKSEEGIIEYVQERAYNMIEMLCQSDYFVESIQDRMMMIEHEDEEVKLLEAPKNKRKKKSKSTKCFACDRTQFVSFQNFCEHVHKDHSHLTKCPYCKEDNLGETVGKHIYGTCRKFVSIDKNSLFCLGE